MGGRMLAVLMWKHLTVRIRRFIHTPIEFLSPLVFFLLLFAVKNQFKPIPPPSVRLGQNEIKNTDEIQLKDMQAVTRVLYTPDTDQTSELMDAVGAQLGLKRLDRVPDRDKHHKGYYAFTNFTEINDIVSDLHFDEAVVIFDSLKDRDTWTDLPRLTYTIRMKSFYYTNAYEPDDNMRTHSRYGTAYHQFLRLQWAIDTSFIKLLTGYDVTQALSIQEFPSYGRAGDEMMAAIGEALAVVTWMSLFLVFVFLMARLLEERSTGIQELVKMVGVSSNLFGISHFLNVLPAGLVYAIGGTVLLTVSSNPWLEHTSPMLIFIVLALHFVSVVAMAFACSYIVQSTQYTVSLAVLVYVLLWQPARALAGRGARGAAWLGGLMPHVPVAWFFDQVAMREQYGEGINFSDIMTSPSSKSAPVFVDMVFLVVQSLIFFGLAWYLSLVRPGKYGQALPWNFLFKKQYWTKNEVKPDSVSDEETPIAREPRYFEDPPANTEAGIRIENVSKVYPKHKALSDVSLDVYKGEITVLLGHNGAGKTTLMSIITGMTSATSGRVLVNGLDVRAAGAEVRTQLGLCPQHNLAFPDLTVLEHVMFFALLKGGSYTETREKSRKLLDTLGLGDKANVYSRQLSGGMKRRLQLGCALAGGADVLVLDEPTSGLDVETRRELWNLLLSLRGSRTVLLTTHFMEEADALGDRVAALHLGRLRCHATPMHLKKAIGTGYRLTFTTNGLPREPAVTAAVTSHVSDATLKERTVNSLSYNLPASACGQFPALFTSLEDKKSELGIETIGVGVSTLEEVFLKLCSDTHSPFSEDETDSARVEPTFNKMTGAKLYARQLWVLLMRQIKYVWHKKLAFLLMQAGIPILMIILITYVSNNYSNEPPPDRLAANLDLYATMPDRRVMYRAPSIDVKPVKDRWPKVQFIDSDDVVKGVLRASKDNANEYNTYLAGFEINDTHAKSLFTTTVRHAAPVALNLLTNALAASSVARSAGRVIDTFIHPVKPDGPLTLDDKLVKPKTIDGTITWGVLIVFVMLSTNINAVSLPCKERVSGARHIHLMAGCPAALHWIATGAFHALVCCLLLVLTIATAAAVLDKDQTLTEAHFIFSLMLALTLGALAFFALMYVLSCLFEERGASVVLVAVLVIFGLITPITKLATDFQKEAGNKVNFFVNAFLVLSEYSMPPHATSVAVAKCGYAARLNAYCDLNKQKCPDLIVLESGFDTQKCCAGERTACYMCFSKYAPGKEMVILFVQYIVYMTLVLLIENGVLNALQDRIFNVRYRNTAQKDVPTDEIVRAEAIYVSKQIELPKQKIAESNHAMLVSDLHKNYFRLLGKSCNAVRGISFSVKKGECFGLLGVNGAGKSTTFKMLTAEECATRGRIFANGHYRTEREPYLRSLGYCPQFFGLDEFLTGTENLTLLLTLRGLDEADVKREVDSWIQVVGLEQYARRPVAGYSGGCARRLAAAAALASGAPLTLLDEPTAGVDVAARRRVWAALARGLRQGRAVVITSHSMDEMEALCSRIAIMSRGRVRAAGSPSELRARHAAGHAVIIKVKQPATGDQVDSAKSELERFKSSLHHKFNCTLKDEHRTMLHYHINQTMRYSSLFSVLEELKRNYPTLVEDYSVTETTLEEVFLSFAREAQETQDTSEVATSPV